MSGFVGLDYSFKSRILSQIRSTFAGGASEIQAEVAIFPCGFWVILKQVNVA